MKRLISILVFMFALAHSGQGQTVVSGRVIDADGPVKQIIVNEIDRNNRITNSTQTDDSGLFTMSVKSLDNALKVSGTGYLSRIVRMRGTKKFEISLLHASQSVEEKLFLERHPITESYKLLYGRISTRKVPQPVVVELLSDSLLTLSFPIHANNANEVYPIERKMMFVDYVDGPLLTGHSIVETCPEAGEPSDRDNESYSQNQILRYYFGDDYIPGDFSSSTPYYNYPRFVFKINELNSLLMNEQAICRVLIDTARADNYWQLFLQPHFGYELKKIIAKQRKKLQN